MWSEKRVLHIDDSHIVGESDKGVRVALYHAWNVERSEDYNYGVYFFHEERFGRFVAPSREKVWKAYKHAGMDDEWTKRMVEEGAYFIERVSIV